MTRYIVLDTETTGTEPVADDIVELAMISDHGREESELFGLCRRTEIPAEAKAVHHILESDLAGLHPLTDSAISGMLERLYWDPDTYLVAHNAAFDRGMLEQTDRSLAEARWICTWRCAMHLYPDAPRHSNQVLRYWLGLEPPVPEGLAPHRALYDIIVTRAILERMLQTHTLEQLHELSTRPVLLETCRFGKHRGAKWADVPTDYLRWILRQGAEMDSDVRHTALHYLQGPPRLL